MIPFGPLTAKLATTSSCAVPLPLSTSTKTGTLALSTAHRASLTAPSYAKLARDMVQLAVGPTGLKFTGPTVKVNVSLLIAPGVSPLKTPFLSTCIMKHNVLYHSYIEAKDGRQSHSVILLPH